MGPFRIATTPPRFASVQCSEHVLQHAIAQAATLSTQHWVFVRGLVPFLLFVQGCQGMHADKGKGSQETPGRRGSMSSMS